MREPLDIEKPEQLLAYLRRSARITADEAPRLTILAGGVSNLTVLVERVSGESWVLKQALAKLRTEADWFSDPARVHREALGIRWLNELAPPGTIPELVFEDFDHHLIAMHAVPQPHENWKAMLLALDPNPGRFELDHFGQFGALLGAIHRESMRRADELAAEFDDASFFESLRIEPYYLYTAEQVPEAKSFIHDLVRDTRANRIALVHGDYSPKNILIHDGRLVLLDHEVIHWGDPAFDLGFALTHLISKARNRRPPHRLTGGALKFWYKYQEESPAWLADPNGEYRIVRHILACMLARVAGRSPLEYLTDDQRHEQRRDVLRCLKDPPEFVPALIIELALGVRANDADR